MILAHKFAFRPEAFGQNLTNSGFMLAVTGCNQNVSELDPACLLGSDKNIYMQSELHYQLLSNDLSVSTCILTAVT